jgi:hypothetical protein
MPRQYRKYSEAVDHSYHYQVNIVTNEESVSVSCPSYNHIPDQCALSESPDSPWWSELPHLAPQPIPPVEKVFKPFTGALPSSNPTPAQREAIEKQRIACLEQTKNDRLHAAYKAIDAVREENAQVARNRLDDGLGHLEHCYVEDLPKGKLSHKPTAKPTNHILFKVGTQDTVVKSSALNTQVKNKHSGGGKRGSVTTLSRQAMSRMKLHFRNAPEAAHKAILTLTYPEVFPTDGVEVKRHLDLMKRWLKRSGVAAGSWFLEFQARGAPHFHCYLSGYPFGGVRAVANAWFNIVGSGDEKHLAWHEGKLSGRPCLEWFRSPHAASAYATKYATKQEQKDVPPEYQNVGRFWGCWGKSRPVWNYISRSGSDQLAIAHTAIIAFRSRFQGGSALDSWANRAYASCVMWGGSADLDSLLAAAGWQEFYVGNCPF